MVAFLNTNIKDNLCGGCDCSGFVPSVTFVYDAGAQTIVFTDASTYPSDSRKIVKLSVRDKNAKKVVGSIATGGGGTATISTASLDKSEGLWADVTVISTNGCVSDGHVNGVGISPVSAVGSWDKESIKTTA